MSSVTKEYKMSDYGKQSCFSSFLPGIAGIKGTPIWCFYVNRGQGVCSFGVDNKDHAIMEFYPAHMAYQNVKKTGFRTFVRADGKFVELFANEDNSTEMTVGMNTLSIQEDNKEACLQTKVTYYTLPEERVGGLVRKVEITNKADKSVALEILDGMPQLIPFGVGEDSMKSMTQTAKAWMQVEDVDTGIPFYRVRASMDDSAAVTKISGGNFAMAVMADGTKLYPVCDPEVVFDYDYSMVNPVTFRERGFEGVKVQKANSSNLLPMALFMVDRMLEAGQSLCFYELIGQVEDHSILDDFLKKNIDGEYFDAKLLRAEALVNELTDVIDTKTADANFDAYCRYTYMDNVLRGGQPIKLGNKKIFYVYSRKHGDLERDYNYFAMTPEYFSQGNGNFRDVNQNRRLDDFFSPFVGKENIHLFYNLIQLDGYNPLGIEKLTYTVNEEAAREVVDNLSAENKGIIATFITKSFSPGSLYSKLLSICEKAHAEELFTEIMDIAEQEINGNFGEGYWSDHWDYNLDLVEEFLGVYPDQRRELLTEKVYNYFLTQVNVNPRHKRYAKTSGGIRQYHALDESTLKNGKEKLVRLADKKPYTTTLIEKLVLLSTVKFATLDPYGMGVEMEGGKPGWYDALNGAPGLFGSSMAETYELKRNIDFTVSSLRFLAGNVEITKELMDFIERVDEINRDNAAILAEKDLVMKFWDSVNDAKENYRAIIYGGITGQTVSVDANKLADMIEGFGQTVAQGIAKAKRIDGYPTYFTYDVVEYTEDENGIYPKKFQVVPVPKFLEGPVRCLKLDLDIEEKKALYEEVKNSDLYDKQLSMYKVNASLNEASFELGRALAFTPGWLENESVWLHMEYKYLLELVKSGLYREFAEDMKNALIPFLDEKVYGRSILENSSFIASSKNPNEKIHGKGFVARLSGSTCEFLSMWKIMMFGKQPFKWVDEQLICTFEPMLPDYLIGEDKTIKATFLGTTAVEYKLCDKDAFFPGEYKIESMELTYKDQKTCTVNGNTACGQLAIDLRDGKVDKVVAYVNR